MRALTSLGSSQPCLKLLITGWTRGNAGQRICLPGPTTEVNPLLGARRIAFGPTRQAILFIANERVDLPASAEILDAT